MNKYLQSISVLAVAFFLGFSLNSNATNLLGGEDDFIVYPNPATNVINIKFLGEGSESAVISIHNLLGQELIRKEEYVGYESCYIVEITDLPSGIYVIRIDGLSKTLTQRITKR